MAKSGTKHKLHEVQNTNIIHDQLFETRYIFVCIWMPMDVSYGNGHM